MEYTATDGRQKKLELQCKKIEQDIRKNQEVMRGEVEDACWSEVWEILAPYKRYVLELGLEPSILQSDFVHMCTLTLFAFCIADRALATVAPICPFHIINESLIH